MPIDPAGQLDFSGRPNPDTNYAAFKVWKEPFYRKTTDRQRQLDRWVLAGKTTATHAEKVIKWYRNLTTYSTRKRAEGTNHAAADRKNARGTAVYHNKRHEAGKTSRSCRKQGQKVPVPRSPVPPVPAPAPVLAPPPPGSPDPLAYMDDMSPGQAADELQALRDMIERDFVATPSASRPRGSPSPRARRSPAGNSPFLTHEQVMEGLPSPHSSPLAAPSPSPSPRLSRSPPLYRSRSPSFPPFDSPFPGFGSPRAAPRRRASRSRSRSTSRPRSRASPRPSRQTPSPYSRSPSPMFKPMSPRSESRLRAPSRPLSLPGSDSPIPGIPSPSRSRSSSRSRSRPQSRSRSESGEVSRGSPTPSSTEARRRAELRRLAEGSAGLARAAAGHDVSDDFYGIRTTRRHGGERDRDGRYRPQGRPATFDYTLPQHGVVFRDSSPPSTPSTPSGMQRRVARRALHKPPRHPGKPRARGPSRFKPRA